MHTLNARLLLAGLLLIPGLAHAHPGHENMTGLLSGLAHPVFGPDHLLAMLAVGLWGAQLGGQARWVLPVVFVSIMLAGGGLGMLGLQLPALEPGIMASVLVLGLLLLWSRQLPLLPSAALVGLFALFHGVAHGAEMPLEASAATYALGFALATAGLHLMGWLVGHGLQRQSWSVVTRMIGGLLAAAGLMLFAAA